MKSLAGVRTRWAAIGAACAVALGAGGFGVVNAVVSSGEKSVFVPVNPIRVLDTRNGTEISNGTRRLVVEGAITVADGSSQLVVPSAASAVAVNITATSTRKNGGYGFVTVFPCVADSDAVPNASSLNFENGVDIANALNVTTSANGSICLYVYGTADLIVDVAGYFVDHNHDDRYYTEAEVDTALVAKANTADLVSVPIGSTPTTVDATGLTGLHTSIAIGTNGLPIISYQDDSNGDLRVAACTTITCSTATSTTVDATGLTGLYTSIAIGTNGMPIISYYDSTNGDLRVAACTTITCSSSTLTTVDSTGNTGLYTSIAIGTNGMPIISYYDGTNGDLRVAACTTITCSTATSTTVDATGDVGLYTSIAIGTNGMPIISYYDLSNRDLRVAACTTITCSTATSTTVDATGDVGYLASIAIGTNGMPIISYFDLTNGDLRVAACTTVTCSTATSTTVDSTGNTGAFTSIAIGTNGMPVISYFDFTNGDLRVAVPWWAVGGR